MDTVTGPEAGPQASIWEDFVDIYFSPSSVFERRRNGRFGMALIVVTIVLTALSYALYTVLADAFTADMVRAVGRAGEDPQMAQSMASLTRSFAIFGSLMVIPIGALVTGVFLFLVGRMLGADLTFPQGATIATYSYFPRIISTLAGTIQGVLMNPGSMIDVAAGPARFLDPDTASESLVALAARLDIFLLWSVALTAIGVRVIGRAKGSRAWATAIIVWLIGAVPSLIGYIVAS